MEKNIKDTPPPVLGTWNRLYTVILSVHAVILFLFWLFTKTYQ